MIEYLGIRKVVFTGHPSRPGIGQYKNINWLYHMQHRKYRNHNVEVYDTCTISSNEEFIESYTNMEFKEEFIKKYEHELGRDTFIVGFEMPPSTIVFLDRNHIPYINYIVYPIRYCPDLVMGYRSNIESFTPINEEEFYIHANVFLSRYLYTSHLPDIKNPTCLIVGQTDVDTSLINNGDIQKFNFDLLPDKYHKIFKKHPAGRPLNTKIPITNENIYTLLSCPDVKLVTGISSSVLYEAKYFGKEVIRQGKDWADGYTPISASTFLGYNVPENTLRYSTDSWWGYKK